MPFKWLGSDDLVLKRLPRWPNGLADPVDPEDIRKAVLAVSSRAFTEPNRDAAYAGVPPEALKPAHAWMTAYLNAMRIFPRKEINDCDDYGDRFRGVIRDMLAAAGGDRAPAIAQLQVFHLFPALGVGTAPSGTIPNHIVCISASKWGVHVTEPQTGQHCLLAEYPNKTTIQRLTQL